MNIQEVDDALDSLICGLPTAEHYDKEIKIISSFIDEVEQLLKNNSIKQTPALFKPFDRDK
jgi:hypothetical protein